MPSVENHLPHTINTIPAPYFDMPNKSWEGREYIPRSAEATVAVLGLVRVKGRDVPILRRRFTELINDDGIPYDPATLKVVSYETIAAASRSNRPINDLAYPYHIVRDETGQVIGCRGFGMPQLRSHELDAPPGLALTEADIPHLGDPEEWVNAANYPQRLYDPRLVPANGDIIDTAVHDPILDLAPGSAPVDVSPDATIDVMRTKRWGVPILQVSPSLAGDGVRHWPEDPDRLHLVHPIALRHAALLGKSLRFCVVTGGLLRDQEFKTVAGGTALYVFDPEMLASDGM
jgi:hypothetical protein